MGARLAAGRVGDVSSRCRCRSGPTRSGGGPTSARSSSIAYAPFAGVGRDGFVARRRPVADRAAIADDSERAGVGRPARRLRRLRRDQRRRRLPQGVIFTDLDTAVASTPDLVQRILHDQGRAGRLRQVRGAARRVLAGRHVPLRAEGRRGRAAVPLVRGRADGRLVDLHPLADRARGECRSVLRRCLPVGDAGAANVHLGCGRADRRARAQPALRPAAGLGPQRLELHDGAGDRSNATRR